MVEGQTNSDGTMDTYEVAESAQSLIDKANAAAERIEAANRKAEELLLQAQTSQIRERLEGKSAANIPQQTLEETPREYAARVLRGEI